MKTPRSLRPGERPFALLLVVLAGLAFREAHGISGFEGLTTGGVMPMLASGIMIATSLAILSDTARRPRNPAGGLGALVAYLFPLRVVLFAVLIGLYVVAIPITGFIPASTVMLFVAIWGLWGRGPIAALVIALISVGAVYVLFRLMFQVILPSGSLWT